MKKLGFTLSELLVAIGVVAVGAALVAPTVSNIVPDKNKIKVINCYNKISEINQKLLNAPDLFATKYVYEDGKRILKSFGLADENVPLRYQNDLLFHLTYQDAKYSSSNKYRNIFSEMLTGEKYPDSGGIKLEDGSVLEIKTREYNPNTTPITIMIPITFDIDGKDKGKNCSYDANTCKKPDIFKFKVDESGNVTAGDAMTDAYLTTIGKSNSQKDDKELAKKYLEDDDRKANYY